MASLCSRKMHSNVNQLRCLAKTSKQFSLWEVLKLYRCSHTEQQLYSMSNMANSTILLVTSFYKTTTNLSHYLITTCSQWRACHCQQHSSYNSKFHDNSKDGHQHLLAASIAALVTYENHVYFIKCLAGIYIATKRHNITCHMHACLYYNALSS